jgi:xanthine dehydrogenase accessory factor
MLMPILRKNIEEAMENLRHNRVARLVFEAEGEEFVRVWRPKERLILLGGGHIAQPLCEVGALLGFEVVVADDRPFFANKTRFPKADSVICNSFDRAVDELNIGGEDYVCIITRGHRYDAQCLRQILSGAMPYYLGMIGSKRRVSALKTQLTNEGFSGELLDKLNAPIGLPIYAETTAEIAVSIAAQLVEYRRGGKINDGCLKMKNTDEALVNYLGKGMGEDYVLALVLETKGSTPVKDGAIMAVNALGQTYGTIGGGCSEAEIITVARQMVGTGDKKIVWVDMTNDVAESEGMVCGGTMRVLLEDVR